jgi:hypothetical protein
MKHCKNEMVQALSYWDCLWTQAAVDSLPAMSEAECYLKIWQGTCTEIETSTEISIFWCLAILYNAGHDT